MKYCSKKNMNRLRIGGIDNILAYIVVSIPLIYLLIMMIGTLYHYAVQSYISQIVKETVTNASAYGGLTSQMIKAADDSLTGITNSSIKYNVVVKRYVDGSGYTTVYDETFDSTVLWSNGDLHKGDIIGIQVESEKPSMLGTISNFSLFGSVGTTDMHYSGYREDIIRNEGADGW